MGGLLGMGGIGIGGVFVLFMLVLVVPECTPHHFCAALLSQQDLKKTSG